MISNGSDHKPLAALSLDLDNKWSYMKIRGLEGWDSYPSYLDHFIPTVLDLLDNLGLNITFFVVGQDAAIRDNESYLASLVGHGHEVGNHSYNHESWLHLYSRERIREEIKQAEDTIGQATGQRPSGFRGPGFSWSMDLLEVLAERGYTYDSSSLPTYIGPVARAYYFLSGGKRKETALSDAEKEQRKKLFGSFRDGLKPVKPYAIALDSGGSFLEIPVTTIPVLKTPFHLSYLMYLAGISTFLMSFYLSVALRLCSWTGTAPCFLLHPLDFMSAEQAPELAFFPAMSAPAGKKIEIAKRVLGKIAKRYQLVNMSKYAAAISRASV